MLFPLFPLAWARSEHIRVTNRPSLQSLGAKEAIAPAQLAERSFLCAFPSVVLHPHG